MGVGDGQNPPHGRQMGFIHAAQFSRDCPCGHPGKLAVSERWSTARSCTVVAHTMVTVISVVSACARVAGRVSLVVTRCTAQTEARAEAIISKQELTLQTHMSIKH